MPSSSTRFGSPNPPTFLLHHTDEMSAPFVILTTSTREPDINSSFRSPLAIASNRPTVCLCLSVCEQKDKQQ